MITLFDQETVTKHFGEEMRAEGREEGRGEVRREAARSMSENGMGPSRIAEIPETGEDGVRKLPA